MHSFHPRLHRKYLCRGRVKLDCDCLCRADNSLLSSSGTVEACLSSTQESCLSSMGDVETWLPATAVPECAQLKSFNCVVEISWCDGFSLIIEGCYKNIIVVWRCNGIFLVNHGCDGNLFFIYGCTVVESLLSSTGEVKIFLSSKTALSSANLDATTVTSSGVAEAPQSSLMYWKHRCYKLPNWNHPFECIRNIRIIDRRNGNMFHI